MNDQEAHDFYARPENLRPTGPGRKRQGPVKSAMVPVRFPPQFIEHVKSVAHDEGITVSAWIRRAASRELEREARDKARHAEVIPGSGRPGAPRAMQSSLSRPQTFRCKHISASGLTALSCWLCGPLDAVA